MEYQQGSTPEFEPTQTQLEDPSIILHYNNKQFTHINSESIVFSTTSFIH